MEYVDYGLSAFHASVFSAAGEPAADLTNVFQDLIRRRALAGFEVEGTILRGGIMGRNSRAQAYLSRGRPKAV